MDGDLQQNIAERIQRICRGIRPRDTVPPATDAIVNSLAGIKVEGRTNRSEIGVGAQPGWYCGVHWPSVGNFDLTPAIAAILCAALAIILAARNGTNDPTEGN
jgi:hypothetical protein